MTHRERTRRQPAFAQHRDGAAAMDAAADHRRLRPARHSRHRAVARPGRRGGTQGLRRCASATRGLTVTGYCRGGMFPAVDREGRRAAHDDNRRAVDEALDARRPMPDPRRRRPAQAARRQDRVEGSRPVRAKWCATASASSSSTHAARACRSRSSRCIRCTPPTARASTRWRTPTTSATSSGAGVGIAVDAYHVWWDPHLEREIERAGGASSVPAPCLSHLRLAGADHRPPDRPRHDGRWRDRSAPAPLVDGSTAAIAASTRSRSFPPTTGGSAIPTRCSRRARRGIASAADVTPQSWLAQSSAGGDAAYRAPAREQHGHHARRHHQQRDVHRIPADGVRDAGIGEPGAGRAEHDRGQRKQRDAERAFRAAVPRAQHEQRDADQEQERPEHRRRELDHRFEAVVLERAERRPAPARSHPGPETRPPACPGSRATRP